MSNTFNNVPLSARFLMRKLHVHLAEEQQRSRTNLCKPCQKASRQTIVFSTMQRQVFSSASNVVREALPRCLRQSVKHFSEELQKIKGSQKLRYAASGESTLTNFKFLIQWHILENISLHISKFHLFGEILKSLNNNILKN